MPGDTRLDLAASLCAKASPAERALLLDVLPPSLTSRLRYAARDIAVLDAFAAVGGAQPTPAAHHIAREFARYLASAWAIERGYPLLPSTDPLRAALQRLARDNGGEPIGPRQLLRIRDGARR